MAKKQESSSSKSKSAPPVKAKATKTAKPASDAAAAAEKKPADKKPSRNSTAKPPELSKELIGETAGHAWSALDQNGGQTVASLMKAIDAPDALVLLALGWLAREDKLAFETNGKTVTVSLR